MSPYDYVIFVFYHKNKYFDLLVLYYYTQPNFIKNKNNPKKELAFIS